MVRAHPSLPRRLGHAGLPGPGRRGGLRLLPGRLPPGAGRPAGAGWKGSGLVRWAHQENRPFLRCLDGLRSAAGAIGEQPEEERCAQFLRQLDPSWRPDWTGIPA